MAKKIKKITKRKNMVENYIYFDFLRLSFDYYKYLFPIMKRNF